MNANLHNTAEWDCVFGRRSPHPHRGYALATVLLVAVILSGAITALFFQVAAAERLGAATRGERRAYHLCNGVVSVATLVLRKAAVRGASLASLNTALDPLREGVEADGITIDELRADPNPVSRISVVPSGPLSGLEVSIVDLDLSIALKGPGVPPCRARHTQPLASVSLFQFPALSSTSLLVPRAAHFNVPHDSSYAWGQFAARVEDPPDLKARTLEDAALSLPEREEGVGVGNLQFLLTSKSSRERDAPATPAPPVRPTSPTSPTSPPVPTGPGAITEKNASSLADDADIRIIDGTWYLRDPRNPSKWPGTPMWSDHPCEGSGGASDCSNTVSTSSAKWTDDTIARRRFYSHYERNAHGFLDGSGGAGVVSYGGLLGTTPGGNLSSAVCKTPGVKLAASCDRFDSTASPASLNGRGGPRAGLLDATRNGFSDPGVGPVLPINFDVGILGFALDAVTGDELGSHVCLPRTRDDPGGCARVFNGIIYITTSRGRSLAAGGFSGPPAAGDAAQQLPWPLCAKLPSGQNALESGETPGLFDGGVARGCDDNDWVRPNAVRLINGGDLSRFRDTGLTIATDLPLYVQGDWNTRGGNNVATALMGERVTVLSNGWSDRFSPIFGSPNFPGAGPPPPPPALPPPPPPTPFVRMQSSIFSGNDDGSDVSRLLRRVEPRLNVEVRGSLVIGFRSIIGDRPPGISVHYPNALRGASTRDQPPGAPRAAFVLPGARRQ